jgi:uncharacterized damage-inducible protein DinB
MTASLLGDAFAHHMWATEQLIDACAALTPEQLETFAPGTRGPVIETLRHIVGSDGWYLSSFRTERPVPAGAEKTAGLSELRSMIVANGAAWSEVLAGDPDPDVEVVENDDKGVLYSAVGVCLAQVVHHGTDHRSQICTALTNLGVTPPDIDVWAYARATGRERWVPAPTS